VWQRTALHPQPAPAAVGHDATAAEVQEASRTSGHLRILVQAAGRLPDGVVHVRDTLLLADDASVADVTRPVFELAAGAAGALVSPAAPGRVPRDGRSRTRAPLARDVGQWPLALPP
jgi:hypothetical protein